MVRRVDRAATVWAVFVFLSSVYLLTYRGLLRSVDELALFSLTESLVQTHSTQTPQLAFAEYHNPVGRLEPLHSTLAVPLYWLAVQSKWLGNVQTVMLLNVALTAATGATLYAWLLLAGHRPRHAVLGALVYGLATIAWPYSRGFFREPLLALLLTVAGMGFVRWRQTRHLGWGALTVLCLALAVVTKVTAVLTWVAFGLAFVMEAALPWRARLRRLGVVAVLGLLGGVLSALVYATRGGGSLIDVVDGFLRWGNLSLALERIFGLTLGAGRGLFVYCPVLLLALPGLVVLWRERREEAILILSCLAAFLIGYGGYGSWYGGMVWGARFLVPVVPLLVVSVTECLSLKRPVAKWSVGLVVVVSVVMQGAAASADASLQVEAGTWENLTDYRQSPAVQQLAIWRPQNLDMLWMHGPALPHWNGLYVNVWIALPLAAALLGATLLCYVAGKGHVSTRRLWVGSLLLGGVWAAGALHLLVRAPRATHGYPGVNPAELDRIAEIVNQDQGEPRVIVTVSNDYHLHALMNGFKGRFVHYWFSPAQRNGFDELSQPALPARSLRLIVDRVHLPPDSSGREAEFWLNTRLHRYYAEWVGEGYEVYSYLYPPEKMPLREVEYRWAARMTMSAVGMTPLVVAPGEPVWLKFHCGARKRPRNDFDIFVQFLDWDGHFINGTDGPPQFGAAPTSSWRPRDTIVDRRAFYVPEGTLPGKYQVIAGFYRKGKRNPVSDGSGQLLGTHIELGQIEVVGE